MRIAHIGRYRRSSSNGVDRTIIGLCDAQIDQGHDVEIWEFHRRKSRITDFSVASNPSIVRISTNNMRVLSTAALRLIRDRCEQIDVMHAHSVFIPEQTQAVRGFRYVVTPNGGYMPSVLNGRNRLLKQIWFTLFERRYLEQACAIHAVSRPEAEYLGKLLPRSTIIYAPNGIDCSNTPLGSKEMKTGTLDFRFLGRLAVEQKGLDVLLEAFARSELSGRGTKLLIAGPDFRNGRLDLEQMIRLFGLNESVELLGELSGKALNDFLLEPSIFVHPSRWEGMPFSVLEALAHGMPAIVTPGTNLADAVSGHSAGWVCPLDAERLAECMKSAGSLSNDEFHDFRLRARRLVENEFSWLKTAKTIDACYKAALGTS